MGSSDHGATQRHASDTARGQAQALGLGVPEIFWSQNIEGFKEPNLELSLTANW